MSHRQLFASGETIREQKDEIARLQAEIERLRLTDAERDAIKAAAIAAEYYDEDMDGIDSGVGRTLRALLERLG